MILNASPKRTKHSLGALPQTPPGLLALDLGRDSHPCTRRVERLKLPPNLYLIRKNEYLLNKNFHYASLIVKGKLIPF